MKLLRPSLLCLALLSPLLHASDAPTTLVTRGSDGATAERVRALLAETARRATADLALPKGYDRFDDTRLPVPQAAQPTTSLMLAAGHGRLVDQLMADINRGVELAAGKSMPLFTQLIAQRTFLDADALLEGTAPTATALLCDDRATLEEAWAPVLHAALDEAGYFRAQRILVDNYNAIPVLSDIEGFDVEPELRQRGINGICLRMLVEEARLRQESPAFLLPAATSEPLAAPVTAVTAKPSRAERAAIAVVRELLEVAGSRAVASLARPGGYLKNPALRIGLPEPLQAAAAALREAGQGRVVDDLESDLNVSAEIAAPQMWPTLQQSIKRLPVRDAQIVLHGADDTAATQVLRNHGEGTLVAALRAVMPDTLRRTGTQDSLQAFNEQYRQLRGEKLPAVDIEQHVVDGAANGLYAAIGNEETLVRQVPEKRSTQRLRKAFAAPAR